MSTGFTVFEDDDEDEDGFDESAIVVAAASDDVVQNAIKIALRPDRRRWEAPTVFDAALGACGIGALVTTVFGKVVGTSLSIKEMVPMSKERWLRFTVGGAAAAYASAIPVVGQFVAPLGAGFASAAEGKGKANVVRDVGMAAAASAIDGAASIASLGGYAAYTTATAGIGTSVAIFLKAKYYADNWSTSKLIIQERLRVLQSVRPRNVSWFERQLGLDPWSKTVNFLKRQVKKCDERGAAYKEKADGLEKEINEKIEKLKSLFRSKEEREIRKPLLSGGGSSDE